MQKTKKYWGKFFPIKVIREALALIKPKKKNENQFNRFKLSRGDEEWIFDSEDEFFADYSPTMDECHIVKDHDQNKISITFIFGMTIVCVESLERKVVQEVFTVFEENISQAIDIVINPESDVRIFIGHGRSKLWRELKDHLHDKHSYPVEAYEIGARAGHVIRDILEQMLDSSSFALLVMTGEDKMADGKLLARQNVIHETGLFQGKLGFSKAIVLLEEGTEEFSNLAGIQQIRFSKGNIKETFGDVLATIKREFFDTEI
ncbi:MAG: nucleotide-binding protein [Chloroflexi bacterium]|nr:nucleotide-binding protein [Chloroflexota bacterium]